MMQTSMSVSTGVRETPDIETASEDYARRFAGPAGAWMLEVQAQIVLRLLNAWPSGTVLEVGGGHGQLTGALLRRGERVTVHGSDERCRRRVASLVEEGRCRFVTGDLLRLPFPDRSFDVVIGLRLLAHMTDWPSLIGQMCRVSNRAVIVDYPRRQGLHCLKPLLFGMKKRIEGNTRGYREFRDTDVDAVFHAYGFRSVERTPEFFFPMVAHRTLQWPRVSKMGEGLASAARLTPRFGSPVVAMFVASNEAESI